MKAISIKKALELYGAENIEIHRGFRYRSGFFDKEGQTYYFFVSCIGQICGEDMMIRTAKDRKDFTGGINTFPMTSFLKERGYHLSVPLTRKDFNHV